jgi:hypothetical protein
VAHADLVEAQTPDSSGMRNNAPHDPPDLI